MTSTASWIDEITMTELQRNPYPVYDRPRAESPLAYVPVLGSWVARQPSFAGPSRRARTGRASSPRPAGAPSATPRSSVSTARSIGTCARWWIPRCSPPRWTAGSTIWCVRSRAARHLGGHALKLGGYRASPRRNHTSRATSPASTKPPSSIDQSPVSKPRSRPSMVKRAVRRDIVYDLYSRFSNF